MTTLSPIEYEQYCLSIFRLEGWNAKTTPATGDQGADLLCESSGTRVVVQCKKYSQPVGNAAVQEVLAARVFYSAAFAVVVTNASFTKAAVALADKTLVQLLHDTQLREWAKKYRGGEVAAISSTQEMMAALNLHGYRVKRAKSGVFSVNTDSGIRHITGEGAFLAYAEQLLK
jgi:restriction endonuclease Mrr